MTDIPQEEGGRRGDENIIVTAYEFSPRGRDDSLRCRASDAPLAAQG